MAWLPIANVAINYRDYGNNWIKAYDVGSTTPKAMALQSTGGTQVAKLEINTDGFLVSASAALVIPYINGLYDLWMFPTEAEADANDTSNALRIADGSQGEGGASVKDPIILTDGQLTVVFPNVNVVTAIIKINGNSTDRGTLFEGVANDYTVTNNSTILLTSSYPAGTIIQASGFEVIESGVVVTVFGRIGAIIGQFGDYIAGLIGYDNTTSGLTAENVQAAIDELTILAGASTMKTAHYSHTMASISEDVTITAVGSLANAFIVMSYKTDSSFTSSVVSARFTTTTNVRLDAGVISNTIVEFTVVEG